MKTRYSYHQRMPTDMQTLAFDGLVKYDHENGAREVYEYPKGWYGNETPFAKSTRGGAEDRGYAVTLATNAEGLQIGSLDLGRAAHQQRSHRSRRLAGPRADRLPRSVDSGPPVVAVTHPPWFDPRMPRREDCVLKAILDDRAARVPDRRLALFEEGTQWTWREGREQARAQAAALQALGVRAGDRVVAWLPNGPALVRAWFAINYLGAVFVPLNTAYRGASLQHTINACRAKLVLAHAALVERLEGLSLEHVERVIVRPRRLIGDARNSTTPRSRSRGTLSPSSTHPARLDCRKASSSPYLQLYTTATVVYGYLREGEDPGESADVPRRRHELADRSR